MGRVAVRQHTANRAESENGDLRGEANDAEQSRGTGESINQPTLRYLLHPGAAHGDQLSAQIQFVVAMTQRAPQSGILMPCRHTRGMPMNNVCELLNG